LNTDQQYMELAIEEARNAKRAGELPIGAVITCNGQLIARNRCELWTKVGDGIRG